MALSAFRRQDRADETRRRLLDAAAAVFAAKGYHDAAVDDIVHAADRSKGAAYFHFPSKRDIFTAVIERLAGLLEKKVEGAISAEEDPTRRLDAALGAVLEAFTKHRRLARIALIEVAGAGPAEGEAVHAIRTRFARLIQRHLEEAAAGGAIPPVNARLASLAWFGAISELVVSWLRSSPRDRFPADVAELRTLLLRSVSAELPSTGAGPARH